MKPPIKGTWRSKVDLIPGPVLRPDRILTRIMLPTILHRQQEVVAQGVEQTILKRQAGRVSL